MSYDGLGERLAMTAYADGQDVTTHYTLDNGQALKATVEDQTTFYLYGLGPIAELTDAWSYSLSDSSNTPRHMTDAGGKVTLTASYTPWGDLLSIEGEGGFTWGYFGGMMDTATGLIYLGNGQYYDPQTGRFLTRNARPDQGNPYVPWQGNPSGALISPLALLALIYGRKRKRSKWDMLVILLVFGATMGMSLSACNGSTTITVNNSTATATVVIASTPSPKGTQLSITITATPVSDPGQPITTVTLKIDCSSNPQYSIPNAKLVAARIYYEGGSSIEDPGKSLSLFNNMVYAVKSLHDLYVPNRDYESYTRYPFLSIANPDCTVNP